MFLCYMRKRSDLMWRRYRGLIEIRPPTSKRSHIGGPQVGFSPHRDSHVEWSLDLPDAVEFWSRIPIFAVCWRQTPPCTPLSSQSSIIWVASRSMFYRMFWNRTCLLHPSHGLRGNITLVHTCLPMRAINWCEGDDLAAAMLERIRDKLLSSFLDFLAEMIWWSTR